VICVSGTQTLLYNIRDITILLRKNDPNVYTSSYTLVNNYFNVSSWRIFLY
jgi:hypothetical protein